MSSLVELRGCSGRKGAPVTHTTPGSLEPCLLIRCFPCLWQELLLFHGGGERFAHGEGPVCANDPQACAGAEYTPRSSVQRILNLSA